MSDKEIIINSLYEFKTPIGLLGMGYHRKSIPHIIEYINNTHFIQNNIIRYSSVGNYRRLEDSCDLYLVFSRFNTDKNIKFNQKLYSDITEHDLRYSKNFFVIMSSHDETIVDYIIHNNISNFFFKETLSFLKQNPTVKILFIDDKEGSYNYSNEFFNSFYNFFIENNLHENQIVFITNTLNVDSIYEKYINSVGLNSFMNVKPIPFIIYPAAGECVYHYDNDILPKTTEYKADADQFYSLPILEELDVVRDKYYMCLNRNSGRFHRPKLIMELIKSNLFDKGLISLLQSDEFDKFCKHPSNIEYKTLIGDNYPFVVDVSNPEIVSSMHNFFTKKDIWLNSYFSLVSETSVGKEFTFITEKTIRPIIYYHPFIVWGNPNTLLHLKKMGFETFPEFFDETYDLEENASDRMNMIVKNVKRLCEMDISEIHSLYQSVKPKLIHNRNLLIELYTSNKIFNDLIEI
jgi:hypothetical protein